MPKSSPPGLGGGAVPHHLVPRALLTSMSTDSTQLKEAEFKTLVSSASAETGQSVFAKWSRRNLVRKETIFSSCLECKAVVGAEPRQPSCVLVLTLDVSVSARVAALCENMQHTPRDSRCCGNLGGQVLQEGHVL